MLNVIWSLLVIISVVCSFLFGRSENLSSAMVDSGADAVELLLTLAGILTLWSGIMKIAEKSGLTSLFARMSAPLLRLLFPALDKNGEAFGIITMNLTANLLGLGNTATPLGLRAMAELDRLTAELSETAQDSGWRIGDMEYGERSQRLHAEGSWLGGKGGLAD